MPAATIEPPASVSTPTAAPTPEINVSAIPAPSKPIPPPKPGSARDRMRQEMAKKFGGETEAPPAPKPAEKAPEKPAEAPKPEATEPEGEAPKAAEAPKPSEAPADGKKVSPWKLVEQFKERAAKAEQRALDLEKQLQPEPERKAQAERFAAIEKRAQELEEEIRYVNYSKSKEFQDKHQKPYEQAWQRAMSELHELTITDPNTQQARAITANDMAELVGMPLQQARDVANKLFGDFADDVMSHRAEIKRLFQEQSAALEEAKKTGAEREAKRKEEFQKIYGTVSQQTKETWDKANAEVLQDPKLGEFFKPREGDEEWNTRLDAGFKLVAQAFSENPMDPRLTPEQRAAVVKRHAAVRNMAAGWRPLRHEVSRLKKQVSELEGELKKYKETTPATGGTVTAPATVKTGSAREQLMAGLAKLAK